MLQMVRLDNDHLVSLSQTVCRHDETRKCKIPNQEKPRIDHLGVFTTNSTDKPATDLVGIAARARRRVAASPLLVALVLLVLLLPVHNRVSPAHTHTHTSPNHTPSVSWNRLVDLLLLPTEPVLQLAAPKTPQGRGGERAEPTATSAVRGEARGACSEDAAHQAAVLLAGLPGRAVRLLPALAVRAAVLLLLLVVPTMLLLLVVLTAVPSSVWLLTILLLMLLLRRVLLMITVAVLLVLWIGRWASAVAVLGRWRSVSVLLAVLGSGGAVGLLRRWVVAALLTVGRMGLWRIRALGCEIA